MREGKVSGKSCRLKTIVRIEEDGDNKKVRKCKSKAAERSVKKRRKNLKDYYRDCSKNLKSRTKLTMKKKPRLQ